MEKNSYIFLVVYSIINIAYLSKVKIGYFASLRENYQHKHV